MFPTPAVEYLLSIVRPERLVAIEATQILIPAFPPNTVLSFSAGPLGGDYGQIITGLGLGSDMVPNSFTGYVQIWGTRQIIGTFTERTITMEFQTLIWVTQAEPSLIHITNVSGLNQLCELDYSYLRVATQDNYDAIVEALEHMATSAKSEQLAIEANQLLTILTGGAPQPPIGIS